MIKRPIKTFKLSVDILRTVSGIRLPVRCYIVDGLPVGSCNYTADEMCKLISNWWPKTFGLYLTSLVSTILGNNCNGFLREIPINQIVTYNEILELPNLSGSILSFLMSGDFDVKIVAMEQNIKIFCGTFKYTIKPIKNG
ncbi:unnamed protein product [Rotaria sordida]|uniref:Uncharacterized protein n=1 Tax=Rotaria sordida TaxID=392033 RepID=A0A813Z557_9BILA|nr:unnamed protein product [Rotaria sordida]CAF0966915.1 unnamed protein product [Rotaria sordida]CAF1017953.1 unnamed protein product [Rotaria sordida]CAF3490928.1 unnamed protein product [Rotaria sordida]